MLEVVKVILGVRQAIQCKVDESTRKLYLKNCFKVQTFLDKFFTTGEITLEDINTIALANQEAELYLNDEIIELTRQIWNIAAEYHSYTEENKKTNERNHKEELDKYRKELSTYKINLTKYYRKYLVNEELKLLKCLKAHFKKLRRKETL